MRALIVCAIMMAAFCAGQSAMAQAQGPFKYAGDTGTHEGTVLSVGQRADHGWVLENKTGSLIPAGRYSLINTTATGAIVAARNILPIPAVGPGGRVTVGTSFTCRSAAPAGMATTHWFVVPTSELRLDKGGHPTARPYIDPNAYGVWFRAGVPIQK